MAERDQEKIKHEASADLPVVDSPPLSPAGASSEEPVEAEASAEAEMSIEAEVSPETETNTDIEPKAVAAAPAPTRARFKLSRRSQHRVTLAMWVALVAGLGALFGGAVSSGLTGREQHNATQQSIDQLAKQVGELKAKLAAATAETHSQIAKISARADRESGGDITGSIPSKAVASIPIPRPAPPRIAAVGNRTAVVHDWRVLRSRLSGGVVAVEGRDGIFEVVPGAVLPGLGPVQAVERRAGRWVVVTPKGLIISARDRGYFQDF